MSERSIRPATLADLPGIYRVCLVAGYPDEDIGDGRNPDLLGHVYAGPYVVADASLCAVVVDPLGVAGYLLATADARAFEAWAEEHWWPTLRAQYPAGSSSLALDAEVIGLLHTPPTSPTELLAEHPAQLHIDLLDRARGTGAGRTLIDDLCARLDARGVRGVHLGVGRDNTHAIGFYRHLGFTDAVLTDDTAWMVRGW